MRFKLYTTVDITHTRVSRNEVVSDKIKYQEQNFNTVVQTLGLRANIIFSNYSEMFETRGDLLGFNTPLNIKIWRFDFETHYENVYLKDSDPVGLLKDDFELVPYISGLDESIEQNYNVFITEGNNTNIIFFSKTTINTI